MTLQPVRVVSIPRDRDEQLLDWIAWRVEGFTPSEIANHSNVGRGAVARATDLVRKSDAAESGESIEGAYW